MEASTEVGLKIEECRRPHGLERFHGNIVLYASVDYLLRRLFSSKRYRSGPLNRSICVQVRRIAAIEACTILEPTVTHDTGCYDQFRVILPQHVRGKTCLKAKHHRWPGPEPLLNSVGAHIHVGILNGVVHHQTCVELRACRHLVGLQLYMHCSMSPKDVLYAHIVRGGGVPAACVVVWQAPSLRICLTTSRTSTYIRVPKGINRPPHRSL